MVSSGSELDTETGAPAPVSAPTPAPAVGFPQRAAAWIHSESLLLAVLAGSFLARLLVATRNSYWLDEIYQVTIHGAWNETVTDLVRVLANNTVYPPLYFVALYEWMGWFGDSEFATRLLSNIYVTLAGLFLYLAIRIGFSRRTSLLSVVTYSLLYTTTVYGLEARPYAQTIFLVTVSSYLWLRLLRCVKERGWRLGLVSPTGSAFTIINVAVLLTHYYNLFFWIAQLIISCLFVLADTRACQWFKGIAIVLGVFGFQAAIFVGVWGRNTLAAVERQASNNTIDGAAELRHPIELALDSVVSPNIRPPTLLMWLGGALVALAVVKSIGGAFRRVEPSVEHLRAWVTVYLANWLMMPLVVAYLGFLGAGVARVFEPIFRL